LGKGRHCRKLQTLSMKRKSRLRGTTSREALEEYYGKGPTAGRGGGVFVGVRAPCLPKGSGKINIQLEKDLPGEVSTIEGERKKKKSLKPPG